VIQPVGASRDDLMPAVKEFNALKKAGIPTKKLLFILNHVGSKAEAEVGKEYLQETGYFCLEVVLLEKVSFRLVQNEGKSITEVFYKALRKQTKKLVESILDYV
jgi:chromosome partitioning protein